MWKVLLTDCATIAGVLAWSNSDIDQAYRDARARGASTTSATRATASQLVCIPPMLIEVSAEIPLVLDRGSAIVVVSLGDAGSLSRDREMGLATALQVQQSTGPSTPIMLTGSGPLMHDLAKQAASRSRERT